MEMESKSPTVVPSPASGGIPAANAAAGDAERAAAARWA